MSLVPCGLKERVSRHEESDYMSHLYTEDGYLVIWFGRHVQRGNIRYSVQQCVNDLTAEQEDFIAVWLEEQHQRFH